MKRSLQLYTADDPKGVGKVGKHYLKGIISQRLVELRLLLHANALGPEKWPLGVERSLKKSNSLVASFLLCRVNHIIVTLYTSFASHLLFNSKN